MFIIKIVTFIFYLNILKAQDTEELQFAIDLASDPDLTKAAAAVQNWFQKEIQAKYFLGISNAYTTRVEQIVADVQTTTLRNITRTIALSEELGRLTQTALAVFARIEQVVDDYELFLSKMDLYIRQEYTHKKNILYSI